MVGGLRLIGFDLTSQLYTTADAERALARVTAVFDPLSLDGSRELPRPLFPVAPVFANDQGQQVVILPTSEGNVALPYQAKDPIDLESNRWIEGGYLSLETLQTTAHARPQPSIAGPIGIQELTQAALRVVLQAGLEQPSQQHPARSSPAVPSGKNKEAAPNLFQELGSGLLTGIGQMLFRQAIEQLGRTGSLGGLAESLSRFDPGTLVATGLQHLASMGMNLAIAELWPIDDTDSTGAHAARQFTQQLLGMIQNQLLGQLAAGLGLAAAPSSLATQLGKFFGIVVNPTGFPALRNTDLDPNAFPIQTGSPNVIIEGLNAAREGDTVLASGTRVVYGSGTVNFNGLPAARATTSISFNGPFPPGAVQTFIGGPTVSALALEDLPPGGSCSSQVVVSKGGRLYDPQTRTVYDPQTGRSYPLASDYIFDPDRDLIIDTNPIDGGEPLPMTFREFDFEDGWSTSLPEYDNLPDLIPEALRDLFRDSTNGHYYLLGGLVDLGSPEWPGAGDGTIWWIPDRIGPWNMNDYFTYHDFHFNPNSLANLGQLLGVEIASFAQGLHLDPVRFGLQIIYSAATTGVALVSATINDLRRLVKSGN